MVLSDFEVCGAMVIADNEDNDVNGGGGVDILKR